MNLLIESQLTPTELFIIRLLYLCIDGETKPLQNYISNISNGKALLRQVLESLMEKKVINNTYSIPKEGESLNVKNIPFNKNFLKKYIRESNEIGVEFFNAYPPFINIGGKMCSIKNVTKAGVSSFEEFCTFYGKSIKNSAVAHKRVLEAVEFGKTHNLIHYSIVEFLASKKWEEIEFIRDSGDVNGYNNSELL